MTKQLIDPLAPAAYLLAPPSYEPLAMPKNKAFAYIVAGNGLYKWVIGRHFSANVLVVAWPGFTLPGLPLWPRDSVTIQFGKLPGRLLDACIHHARRNMNKEILYQFHIKGTRVHVARPAQIGTAGKVTYAADEFDPSDVILDLHSHHRMRANFSQTDNNDEAGLRFYGIIGDLDNLPCEFRMRVGVYGDFAPVPASAIFSNVSGLIDDVYWKEYIPERGR